MSTESSQIGGVEVEIVRKNIKNLHIGCYPPHGHVRVAAPEGISDDAIRMAVLTKMSWIKRKQAQFRGQERQSERRFISGETHFLFGKPLRLIVNEWDKRIHRLERQGSDRLCFSIPADSDPDQRRRWMMSWYKTKLRQHAAPKILHWSERLGVAPDRWGIRPMKTMWGSCNAEKRIVWLNLELAKKSPTTIDYVILHELAHLISPRHDARFISVLDEQMSSWRATRRELNGQPLPSWEEA